MEPSETIGAEVLCALFAKGEGEQPARSAMEPERYELDDLFAVLPGFAI